jgi:fatty acid desaturase
VPALDRTPEGFAEALDQLKQRALASLGPDDLAHRRKIERWGRACTALGYATAWLAPNPFSAVSISLGRTTRWAMIAHHTLHKGYDRVPGAAPHETSGTFARGWRRLVDWLDWIDPEAWAHEHNLLHHYRLGETADPDLVEHNLQWLREAPWPRPLKLVVVGFFMLTWKWSYYAPNTLRHLLGTDRGLLGMFGTWALWRRCLLPCGVVHFVLVPLLFLPLGVWAACSVWANVVLAEALTNLHAFAIIVTNHAGPDLRRFETKPSGRPAFYWRQVVGSTNYPTGGDVNDFLHGWLNYQIEHHLFPELPMSAYARLQPEVKALCATHGVPYVQESVRVRLHKTLAVALGDADMVRETAAQTA